MPVRMMRDCLAGDTARPRLVIRLDTHFRELLLRPICAAGAARFRLRPVLARWMKRRQATCAVFAGSLPLRMCEGWEQYIQGWRICQYGKNVVARA